MRWKAFRLIRDVSRHTHITGIDIGPIHFQEITFNIMLDVPCLEISHTYHINTEPSENIAVGNQRPVRMFKMNSISH